MINLDNQSEDKLNMKTITKSVTIDPVNIIFGKLVILDNTKLVIKYGEHYGLIGKNGIGKTSLLNAITNGQLKIPEDTDIVYVRQEEPETKMSILEILVSTDLDLCAKHDRLMELEKIITGEQSTDNDIIEHDDLHKYLRPSYQKSVFRAQKILLGLGFDQEQQKKSISAFSGGWRMRVSLAKALFMVPTLLILDEPTNHLDLYANIWLSEYLKTYPKTFILVSHDKYLINEVCTCIININQQKLNYYSGNYDQFQRQLDIETKKNENDYKKYEKRLKIMRNSSVPKKEVDDFIKKSQITKPERKYSVKINFIQPTIIKEPYITMEKVSFGYSENNLVLDNINLTINSKTRIAVVGKNGIGKSTLIKLISGDLIPNAGEIIKSSNLLIGYYDQHFENSLPMNYDPVTYLMKLNSTIDNESAHKYLSMFGLEPIHHAVKIKELSGGQKARIKFASFGVIRPHLLLLDEPTNHLDMTTIESLINALKIYDGSIVLITHNFDMVTSLDCDLWTMDDTGLNKYLGDYDSYIQKIYNECDIE